MEQIPQSINSILGGFGALIGFLLNAVWQAWGSTTTT